MAIGSQSWPELNSKTLPQNFLESPILREQSTPPCNDLESFHAETVRVFGDCVGLPVTHVRSPSVASDDAKNPPLSLPRSDSDCGLGFGGAADLNSSNAHLTNDTKINPSHFTEEPEGGCWRIKVIDFGDRLIEVVASKQYEKLKRNNNNKRISKTREDMMPDQLEESERRAKKSIRYKAMMIGGDRLVTFTTRCKLKNRDEANNAWARFIKLAGKQFKDFPFVAVQELHKQSEHIHIHVILNKYYPVNILRLLWHKALGEKEEKKGAESPGNVNIKYKAQYIQGSGNSGKHIAKIARYLSKYVGKV